MNGVVFIKWFQLWWILIFSVCISFPVDGKSLSSEQIEIVDCLLPGVVKKLGMQRTYISRKRPTKTSSVDCEIRGGEYVLYDRANIVSALAVWQESALLGSAQAQYYVGEIFEKGMGAAPDIALAHLWYEKSAQQGYSPALMSLARLYESGFGVKKDLVKAMNYYRQASGLHDDEIAYASVFKSIQLEDKKKIRALQDDLEVQKRITTELDTELKLLRNQQHSAKQTILLLEQKIRDKKNEISFLKSSGVSASNVSQSGQEIPDGVSALAHKLVLQRFLIATLHVELELLNASYDPHRFLTNQFLLAAQTLDSYQISNEEKRQRINVLLEDLRALTPDLAHYSRDQKYLHLKQSFQMQKKVMRAYLESTGRQIETYRKRVRDLETKMDNGSKFEKMTVKYSIVDVKNELAREDHFRRQLIRQLEQLERDSETAVNLYRDDEIDQDELLVVFKTLLSNQGQFYEQQIEDFKAQAETKQRYIALLESRLESSAKMRSTPEGYADDLQREIGFAMKRISTLERIVSQKDQELAQTQGEMERLEQQLLQEQQNSHSLNQQIQQIEAERDSVFKRMKQVLPEDGPVIGVRWPKLSGPKALQTTVTAGSIVNIVGSVYPVNTITRFEIDGQTEELDANGLFLKQIEVGGEDVRIHFLAADDLGVVTEYSMLISPDQSPQSLYDPNAALSLPKIEFGDFYALIVGNNNYDQSLGWPALGTAVADAEAFAKLLRQKYGFKTILKINASRNDILVSLEDLRRTLTTSDNLLIYYAGHGYMDPENDQGYWIPVNSASDSMVNWISNATITDQIRAMTARNVMVIADSCYSGSLMRSGLVSLRSGLSMEKKLLRLQDDVETMTRVALSSGGLQPVADSIGNSSHSVFASALLDVLEQNEMVLDGDSLATQVGLQVSVATQHNVQQVPRYSPLSRGGHQGGEFYFVPKRYVVSKTGSGSQDK